MCMRIYHTRIVLQDNKPAGAAGAVVTFESAGMLKRKKKAGYRILLFAIVFAAVKRPMTVLSRL